MIPLIYVYFLDLSKILNAEMASTCPLAYLWANKNVKVCLSEGAKPSLHLEQGKFAPAWEHLGRGLGKVEVF